MILTTRQIELLNEIYSYFLTTGQFPARRDFRNSHEPSDLALLDTLEYNFSYIRTVEDRYQFSFDHFLASQHGAHERSIVLRLAAKLRPLYVEYGDSIEIPVEQLIARISLPSASTNRALQYLDQLSFVRLHSNQAVNTVQLNEKIRTLFTEADLIPAHAIEKWERDTGKRPPQVTWNSVDSLIGLTQKTIKNTSEQWDALDLTWLGDSALKAIISRDYEECRLAYETGALKCALIMTGACIEGVLLGAILEKQSKDADSKSFVERQLESLAKSWKKQVIVPNELELSRLIQLATSLKLIRSAQTKLGAIVTDYRNHIHPGKEVRTSEIQFDDPEVKHAIQVLRLIVRDIAHHYSNLDKAVEPPKTRNPKRRPIIIIPLEGGKQDEP